MSAGQPGQRTSGTGPGTIDAGAATDLVWPQDRPELLPFLPLVYVAWSDGVLGPEELSRIGERASAQEWLSSEARELLRPWLDPVAPPSPASLEGLKARLRGLASGAGGTPHTLASLGLDLARGASTEPGPWAEAEAQAAIEALEAELGVAGREAVRELMAAQPDAVPEPPDAPTEAPFDVGALAAYLDRPHGALRRAVLSRLEDPAFRFPHDLDCESYRARVLEALRALAAEGWGALAFPAEAGGEGNPGKAMAVFETLAFSDTSLLVKFGVQFGLFGGSVLELGTQRHHERYLGPIGRLELPGCYAMTESGHGSNVRELETLARYDPESDEFVIHTPSPAARKDWIGNAALHGRLATVFAQLELGGDRHGVHAFLVPVRDEAGALLPGVRIEDCGLKVGLNGVDNGRIYFEQVRIPRENLLDRFGSVDMEGRYTSPIVSEGRRFFTMLATLVAGRISIAAASVSASKTGLVVAVRYGARRRQFGPAGGTEVPLLSYLAHQRLLLPELARTYAHHFAVRDLVSRYVESLSDDAPPENGRQVEARAAALKALASDACVHTLQACREACGGQGYGAANRLGRLRSDTDVFTTFEGANPVLLQLVAKALLSEYREAMGDLRLRDVARLMAERAGVRLTKLNPIVTRRTDREHLRDPDFHAAAFRYREDRLLRSAARRLRALLQAGTDTFDAMNACQDHLLALGRAHGERLALEAFHDAVARAPSPSLSETLRSLANLYALSRLEEDRAWYLEGGYFEAPKATAVRAEVNALCGELARSAVALVNAFALPDAVLEAPAGLARPPKTLVF